MTVLKALRRPTQERRCSSGESAPTVNGSTRYTTIIGGSDPSSSIELVQPPGVPLLPVPPPTEYSQPLLLLIAPSSPEPFSEY